LLLDWVETPIGAMLLVADGERLAALEFADVAERMARWLRRRYGARALVPAADPGGFATRLRAYFAGDLAALDGIPLADGGSPFQRAVWSALRRIPAGRTMTYGAVAAALGRPSASRAVGHANGANPYAIVVPCHRLVGSDGALTGYGGGLERKRWL